MVCPSYNVPMFQKLQNLPEFDFTLFVGDKPPPMAPKNGDYSFINHVQLKNYILSFFGVSFIWQSFLYKFNPRQFDVVILSEGVFFISNYFIILICKIYGLKFGFYSHGFNHQRKNSKLSFLLEALRGFFQRRADFIIVYSNSGFEHVSKKNNVPESKILVAKNTLDVEGIWNREENLSIEDINKCRESLDIEKNDFVISFLGRIELEKNPIWVAESVEYLENKNIKAHVIFIGDGSQRKNIEKYKASLPLKLSSRIHILGMIEVEDVDIFLKSSDISVMPGMTGLAIVHSFALGKPYITIQSEMHSPEIEYLKDTENGLITESEKSSFLKAIFYLANDRELVKKMSTNAYEYAKKELKSDKQIKAFADLSKIFK